MLCVQLDSQGLLALLRQAGILPRGLSDDAFRADPALCLAQWFATFQLPRCMMTHRKVLQQLRGELRPTEWRFTKLIRTDGSSICFHFRRMLSPMELEQVRMPPLSGESNGNIASIGRS